MFVGLHEVRWHQEDHRTAPLIDLLRSCMGLVTSSRTPRVVLYARVSTGRDSAGKGQDPQLQLDELRAIAAQRGWTIVGEFVDVGVSGSKERRPQLDALMQRVHRGGVNIVGCWKFDRFARSVRHLVLALDEFRAKGVDFFSARDCIDTSSATGRFTFAIIAAVAELERELIRERTIAGLEVARRKGRRLGRPKVRFDLDEASRLRSTGAPFATIASSLGVSVGTIHRALRELQQSSTAEGVDTP